MEQSLPAAALHPDVRRRGQHKKRPQAEPVAPQPVPAEPVPGKAQSNPLYGRVMVAAIERAADNRWERAVNLAESTEGTVEERLSQLRVSYRRELVSVGAAAGGTAAVPGVGTMAAVGLTATEVAWTATKAAEIVLAVAAVHGYSQASPAQRRSWIMAVFTDGAISASSTAATTMAEAGVGLKAVGARPTAAIQRLNSRMGRYVIARYGAQRTALLVGKLLPFGIGAALGGAANYAMVGAVLERANAFFSPALTVPPPPQLPPPPIAPRQSLQ